ncbi:glycoside hydrolase family 18 protein [Teratosphaeria destructans]|uniref:chitinase n=1 Tax=Teratosphaeria destructans TaxID=418781 RepID=A0A9W7SHX0_9PEZI|nr:glycoside hydrolase family 18 protein [Teratosphaeria destructans]
MARSIYSALVLAWLGRANAGFSKDAKSNVAVYWGQNSYGASSGSLAQQSLATYCANTDIDIIPMAFLYQITSGTGGEPVLNFANQQNNCTTLAGTELIDCPDIGADITTCQETYGKTILLSIGGATYTEGGFTSEAAAISAAKNLWNIFGPEPWGSSTPRPFGSAVIDGFDFDFETSVTNTVAFANELRSLFATDPSKRYYLTAAPQCPYPDAADNSMLSGGVHFDAIFVQFYNNYCGLQSYVAGAADEWNFNFDQWDTWAQNVSANPDVKVLLGVPGDTSAAGSGYEPLSVLQPIIEYCKRFDSFGGVMVWDASQAYANDGFLAGVKSCLASPAKMIRGMRWRF